MNNPTLYEQVGIVIPGSLLLVGVFLLVPEARALVGTTNVSVGEFGIFFLLAYATGHLAAAVGNLCEGIGWRLAGGMPSEWIVKAETALLSPHQRKRLDERVQSRLGIEVVTVLGMDRKAWRPISRQLYADVMRNGKPERIDAFNGSYGLNRGLSASCLILTLVALYELHWPLAIAFFIAALIFGYRAYRFGVHYARELFVQFLAIAEEGPTPKV